MQTLSSFVAAYALNALWQLPLLVLAAAATVRLFAGMRAKVIHRVWLGCLLLSLTLPGLSLLRDQAQPLRGLLTSPQAAMPLAAQAPNVQHNSHGALPPLLSYLWTERPAWNSEHLFPPLLSSRRRSACFTSHPSSLPCFDWHGVSGSHAVF